MEPCAAAPFAVRTILNALRCALGIVRGKFILIFGIAERLLAFRYPIFTGGVWGKRHLQRRFLRKRGAAEGVCWLL